MKKILACIAFLLPMVVYSQSASMISMARNELQKRGLEETEVRARLLENGIDVDNIPPTEYQNYQGRVTAIINQMQAEKAQASSNSTPAAPAGESAIASAASEALTPDDFPQTTQGEAAAEENGFSFTSITTQADTLMEISAGTSDASIIDLLMAGAMVGEGTSYADLTHTLELTTEEYVVGCRKDSDLASYIDDQLKKMSEDGSLMEIAKEYGVQDAVVTQ